MLEEKSPVFKHLSRFKKINKIQNDAIWRQYQIKLDTKHFIYKIAKAQEIHFSNGEKEIRKVIVLEATDKDTKVKFHYELDAEPNVHVLFIGNKNPQRPAGFYKTKKSMIRFRDWTLEENGRDAAWGRSLASQYPARLDKRRYPQFDGDWRRANANIYDVNGNVSKYFDKLSGFYMRTGLWIPVEWKNYSKEGLKILMPTKRKFWELKAEAPEYLEEVFKFAKNNYENQYK
jgi:hypothetical protein